MFLHDEMMVPPGNWHIVCYRLENKELVNKVLTVSSVQWTSLTVSSVQLNSTDKHHKHQHHIYQQPWSFRFLDELCDEQLDPTTSFQRWTAPSQPLTWRLCLCAAFKCRRKKNDSNRPTSRSLGAKKNCGRNSFWVEEASWCWLHCFRIVELRAGDLVIHYLK